MTTIPCIPIPGIEKSNSTIPIPILSDAPPSRVAAINASYDKPTEEVIILDEMNRQ